MGLGQQNYVSKLAKIILKTKKIVWPMPVRGSWGKILFRSCVLGVVLIKLESPASFTAIVLSARAIYLRPTFCPPKFL